MNFKNQLNEKKKEFERALQSCFLNPSDYEKQIYEAMKYSLDAGGKRLRPVLLIEANHMCGGSFDSAIEHAIAIEMIHTYSLIHDDLPAMDNDDFRRGKPTNHKVYGEALAILAGDGLLNTAFERMLFANMNGVLSTSSLRATECIVQAAGVNGMIGGQVVDMLSEGKQVPFEVLDYIHTNKTAALLIASLVAGAYLAGASDEQVESLRSYGYHIGMAFQITDDILDITGDQAKLGKDIGSDTQNNKSTYPSLFGLERSKELAAEHISKAKNAIVLFGHDADFLNSLATFILDRDH